MTTPNDCSAKDSSSQFISSQSCGNEPEYKVDPVLVTCPNCQKSAMTVVETNHCCDGILSCCMTCLFISLCSVCGLLCGSSGNVPPTSTVTQSSINKVTYKHKCSSCHTELGKFTTTL